MFEISDREFVITSVACKQCGAERGLECVGKRGPRAAVHISRYQQLGMRMTKNRPVLSEPEEIAES